MVDALGSMEGRAEAAHDFVEDEDRAVFLRFFPKEVEVAFLGEDEAHVAGNGFDDDGSDIVAVTVHQGLKGGGIVIGDGQGIFGRAGRNPRAVRLTEGSGAAAGFD